MEESMEYLLFKTDDGYISAPPSYRNFITTDNGNAGPRFIRSTLNSLCLDNSLTQSIEVPLGLVISPLADPSQYEA